MSLIKTFEQIQLADAYTRNIVFGYIHGISHDFPFRIPSIIYELCVSFYYAGEHFAYLGYDMYITSEKDNESLKTYNNVIEMTSDDKWNTCCGQVIVDTNLKINYIYEWIFRINTSYSTSIGFGISTNSDANDDALWVYAQSNPNTTFYLFTASINTSQKLTLLSSSSSNWITYDQTLTNNDKIKLVFNVNKHTLQCIINNTDKQILVHNIETNQLKYNLSISMCGRYKVRLLDFKRKIHHKHELIYNKKEMMIKKDYFGDIQIGTISNSRNIHERRYIYDSDEEGNEYYKRGDILTLKQIIQDYQCINTQISRRKLITDFANKRMHITSFTTMDEIYGLIELIILLVIRTKYNGNVVFTPKYEKEISEFAGFILVNENIMDSKSWSIEQFAQKFDQWISTIID